MTLLALTSAGAEWSTIWLVTGLGFAIVLVLLCAFVFLMQGLGAIMQRLEAKNLQPATCNLQPAKPAKSSDLTDNDMAAIAMALHLNEEDDDMAAVAYALHLYYGVHDMNMPRLTLTGHATAWNMNKF